MKVLFIGGTGIVGQYVVPLLRQRHDVTVAALGGGQSSEKPVFDLDIADLDAIERLLETQAQNGEPFDAIINGAIAANRGVSKATVEDKYHYFDHCIAVNARGAYHVYEAAWRQSVPRVVLISSLTATTGPPKVEYVDENTRDCPLDVYAACKVFAEHTGQYFARREDAGRPPLQVISLRLGNLYPSPTKSDDFWLKSTWRRGLMVHLYDVAQSIECALQTDIRFAVYSIISDSDRPRISPSLYRELQYRPSFSFTPTGLSSSLHEETLQEELHYVNGR